VDEVTHCGLPAHEDAAPAERKVEQSGRADCRGREGGVQTSRYRPTEETTRWKFTEGSGAEAKHLMRYKLLRYSSMILS
jgi:hypothetical protein